MLKKNILFLLFLLVFIGGCAKQDEVTITLNSKNSDGFKWEYKYDQKNIISELRAKREENCDDENMCEYKWNFKAKNSGEVILTYQNINSGNKVVELNDDKNVEVLKNEINYIFKVDTKNKIKLIKTFGTTIKNQTVKIK